MGKERGIKRPSERKGMREEACEKGKKESTGKEMKGGFLLWKIKTKGKSISECEFQT